MTDQVRHANSSGHDGDDESLEVTGDPPTGNIGMINRACPTNQRRSLQPFKAEFHPLKKNKRAQIVS